MIDQIILLSMIDQLKAIKGTAEMLIDYVPKQDVYAMIEAIEKARWAVSDARAHVVAMEALNQQIKQGAGK
jgi:hypothetical protein